MKGRCNEGRGADQAVTAMVAWIARSIILTGVFGVLEGIDMHPLVRPVTPGAAGATCVQTTVHLGRVVVGTTGRITGFAPGAIARVVRVFVPGRPPEIVGEDVSRRHVLINETSKLAKLILGCFHDLAVSLSAITRQAPPFLGRDVRRV